MRFHIGLLLLAGWFLLIGGRPRSIKPKRGMVVLRIVERSDGRPVPGATAILNNSKLELARELRTNPDGITYFRDTPFGVHRMSVTAVAHKVVELDVTCKRRSIDTTEVRLPLLESVQDCEVEMMRDGGARVLCGDVETWYYSDGRPGRTLINCRANPKAIYR